MLVYIKKMGETKKIDNIFTIKNEIYDTKHVENTDLISKISKVQNENLTKTLKISDKDLNKKKAIYKEKFQPSWPPDFSSLGDEIQTILKDFVDKINTLFDPLNMLKELLEVFILPFIQIMGFIFQLVFVNVSEILKKYFISGAAGIWFYYYLIPALLIISSLLSLANASMGILNQLRGIEL
tara:strand:- start:1343 stop:1888 length:546 start_codon:yes stop_codon:yes gene_type:complete